MQLVRKSLLASAIFSICSGAMAAGFQITEHSAKGLGRANAGDAALAEDASVIAANPAAMSLINKPTLTVVGAYIMPNIDVQGTQTNYFTTAASPTPTGQNDVAPNAFVPSLYFVMPLNEQWTFGIGAFGNFGLKTDYNDKILSSSLADKTSLEVANINPSLSLKVDDKLSFGFGVDIAHAKATLSSSMPNNANSMFPGQLITKLKGNDTALGWNLGMLYNISPATRVGFSYRSQIDLHIKGDINTGILPQLGQGLLQQDPTNQTAAFLASLPGTFKDSVDLKLPALIELAVNHQLNNQLSLQASLNRIDWSCFDKLQGNTTAGAILLDQPEHWKNAWAYSVGLTYQYSPAITLRAGLKYDQSPVKDEYRTLRIPDSDRTWYTIGASYKVSDVWDIDVGYAHLTSKNAEIHEGAVIENGSPSLTGQFDGRMSGNADIFAMQANYRF